MHSPTDRRRFELLIFPKAIYPSFRNTCVWRAVRTCSRIEKKTLYQDRPTMYRPATEVGYGVCQDELYSKWDSPVQARLYLIERKGS